jgi:hypothetical protein
MSIESEALDAVLREIKEFVRLKEVGDEALLHEAMYGASRQQDQREACNRTTPDPQPAQDREGHDPWEITREDENALRSDYPGSASYSEIAEHAVARVRKRVEADALARIEALERERDRVTALWLSVRNMAKERAAERDEARAEVERLERIVDCLTNANSGVCAYPNCSCAQPPAPVRGPDGPVTAEMVGHAWNARKAEDPQGLSYRQGIARHLNAALAATPTGAGGRVRVSREELGEAWEAYRSEVDRGMGTKYALARALSAATRGRVGFEGIAAALEQGQEVGGA